MVMEFDRPDARLWGIQWLTLPWYENPDVVNRFTSIVGPEAFVNEDGRVRVVISASDPGSPNWLETGEHSVGVIAARWIWVADDGPEIESTIVPLARVRDHLPPDTPVVDESARAVAQARRRACFARRRR
jgi:hypothetical protein